MRLTVVADIASRAMNATAGSPKTVAGAVALDTLKLEDVRAKVANLPKWGVCTYDDAALAVDIMVSQSLAVAVLRVNRDTDAWRQFVTDAQIFHKAMILDSRKTAGWGKSTNLLKFILLGSSCAVALGHALGTDPRPPVINAQGRRLVECTAICDSEIEGPENIEVFKSFWRKQPNPASRLAAAGIDLRSESLLKTEQAEPALLLADYAAGLGLAGATAHPGRLPLPLCQADASTLLSRLRNKGMLIVIEEDFAHTYDDIFGEAMGLARDLSRT